MVRIYVPGLCGVSLRVRATTNSTTWHVGSVNLETQAVETAGGEVISRSAVRWLPYAGAGTWIPPLEAREIVLLLSMIGGMPQHQLLELAWEGMKPKDPPVPKRRLVVPASIRSLPPTHGGRFRSGSRLQASSPTDGWSSRTIATSRWSGSKGACHHQFLGSDRPASCTDA